MQKMMMMMIPMQKADEDMQLKLLQSYMELEGSDRQIALVELAASYFEHYGIEMPNECWDEGLLSDLIDPTDMEKASKALDKVLDYAIEYHKKHTPRVPLDDIARATIFKIMKLTPFGDRIDEMGIGTTKDNLKSGFITLPALELIIHLLKRDPPHNSLIRMYKEPYKLVWIAKKFAELIENMQQN